MSRYKFDFYKQFDLLPPVSGLVSKITSPKGIRRITDSGVKYQFHSDLIQVYDGQECMIEPGLYWVLDVCHVKKSLVWCHYLFIVEDDGTVYPIKQCLNQKNSDWIPKSLEVVKRYFNGESIDPIELRVLPRPKPKRAGWSQFSKK